jgi:hypothetical protein
MSPSSPHLFELRLLSSREGATRCLHLKTEDCATVNREDVWEASHRGLAEAHLPPTLVELGPALDALREAAAELQKPDDGLQDASFGAQGIATVPGGREWVRFEH